jgi:molecular chaperone IbpA
MSKHDFTSLFTKLDQLTVGWSPMLRDFETNYSVQTNYPPHNIFRIDDETTAIELTVAGFKKTDITVETLPGKIIVKGTNSKIDEASYLYRSLSRRDFTKSFLIAENCKVTSAKIEDGILSIIVVKEIPAESLPKLVKID